MSQTRQNKEFPDDATLWEWIGETAGGADGGTRRDLLKLLGFSLGAAATVACRIPEHRAVPLVSQPDGVLPGVSSWYATTCGGCAAGCGLLVKVRDGRPIKIEGNPDSPLSGGGTCAVGQATVLSLYDEHRLRGPLWLGRPVPWSEVDARVAASLAAVVRRGQAIVLLSGTALGPSQRRLLAALRARWPRLRHVVQQPLSLTALRQATAAVFGRPLVPHHRFDLARVVVGLEADFLGTWLSPVEHTRQMAAARRSTGADMPWHVQIESARSLTGIHADRRIPIVPGALGRVALELLDGVARRATVGPELAPIVEALNAHPGRSLVVCGDNDAALQRVVLEINLRLGNVGTTLELDRRSRQAEGDDAAFAALMDAMERGEVGALLILGANPVYDHPQGKRFVRGLEKVALSVSFSDRPDETSVLAHAACPDVHFLESWNDAEPIEGLFQLAQPTIAPLFDARPAGESLLRWAGRRESWYDFVRSTWEREIFPRSSAPARFADFWDRSLERGVVELPPAVRRPEAGQATEGLVAAVEDLSSRRPAASIAARFIPTVALRDGRQANNPWLQELPDPISKLTWGPWIAVSPELAQREGIEDGDVLLLESGALWCELPAVVQPGLIGPTVAVTLGYGRTHAGKVASGLGANLFAFLPLADGLVLTTDGGLRLARTGRRETLARTQHHFSQEGREIARETTPAGLARVRPAADEEPANLWPDHAKPEHFWGMAIDLSVCTGCSACVVACQAENNVAVVGKDEVARGREMHWLRLDRYDEGPPEAPRSVYQPMMCQHCDHAPCETVCPVLATVHSSEGLNQQVYNRCIGTRYCANNCPYKVRRFNWFRYADNDRFDYTMNGELPRMVLNPDVVVRSRGVMEKCSLCIQRIEEGKLAAKQRGEPLADGAIRTACQQACPADAIVFGDLRDEASAVSKQHRDPRFYRVFEELGTRPGVGYLARVRHREG